MDLPTSTASHVLRSASMCVSLCTSCVIKAIIKIIFPIYYIWAHAAMKEESIDSPSKQLAIYLARPDACFVVVPTVVEFFYK